MASVRIMNGGPEPIAIIGAGYVGLTTAAGFAERGHEVWCIDSDPARIAQLKAGMIPISEPGLAESISANSHRIHFEVAVGPGPAFDRVRLIFIAVGTPPLPSGAADLSQITCVIDNTPASADHAIVMKSTVPPGTGRQLIESMATSELSYVSCPEFLQEGHALAQFREPDRVVIGSERRNWAAAAVADMHRGLGATAELIETDVTSAELIKQASNLHLAMRVSFANEIANMSEEFGADVGDVMRGVGADQRIGPHFLKAGLGFGGSCLIKDVAALSQAATDAHYGSALPAAVLRVNDVQIERALEKIRRHRGTLTNQRVAILGLAFKAGTDDIRGATALTLVERLREEGAEICVSDPNGATLAKAQRDGILMDDEVAADPYDALTGAHACVIATEWDEWKQLDWHRVATAMRSDFVLDGRNCVDPTQVAAAGLFYAGTGRRCEPLGPGERTE